MNHFLSRSSTAIRQVLVAAALMIGYSSACGQGRPPAQLPASAAPAPNVRRTTLEEAQQLAFANKALTLARLNVEQSNMLRTRRGRITFPRSLRMTRISTSIKTSAKY
jgi:hypothetical protein